VSSFHIVNPIAIAPRAVGGSDQPSFQSITRATRMLRVFTADEPELTLAELTARLGYSKPTTYRYATALRRAGLLRMTAGAYTLGPLVVELATAALSGLAVIKVADVYLSEVSAMTSQTAVLSVWDGEAPVVVRVRDNTKRMVRIIVAVGSRLPLESAQGEVFRVFTADGDAELEPELETVRRTRISYFAEVVDGVAALASPIFQGDEIVATLALVGTTVTIERGRNSMMAKTLRSTAEQITAALGFTPPEGGAR
jgi:DNA-binding IclR family transcriptional regulator